MPRHFLERARKRPRHVDVGSKRRRSRGASIFAAWPRCASARLAKRSAAASQWRQCRAVQDGTDRSGRQRHGCPHQPLSRGLRALAARPGGLLGRGGAGDRLDRAAEAGVRSGRRRLWPLVRRRRLQHLLERGRPPCAGGRGEQAGDHLRLPARRARSARITYRPAAGRGAGARRRSCAISASARATASSSTCRWCRRR